MHKLAPCSSNFFNRPAVLFGLRRETKTWKSGDDDMERVLCGAAVRSGVSEGIDYFEKLDDRSGPAVCQDQGLSVSVMGADVKEVNREAIELGMKLREFIESRFGSAPVVAALPILANLFDVGERRALRPIGYGFRLGPTSSAQTPLQVVQVVVADVDLKGGDLSAHG